MGKRYLQVIWKIGQSPILLNHRDMDEKQAGYSAVAMYHTKTVHDRASSSALQ